MRNVTLLLLALAALPGHGVRAQGQPFSPARAPAAPAVDYAALASGPTFTSGPETYVVMPGVHAVKAPGGGQATQQTLQAMGVAGTALGQKGPFAIYREAQALRPAAAAPPMRTQSLTAGTAHPVVYNPRTRQMGVVLGTLLVRLANLEDAAAVAQAAGVVLGPRFDPLGIAVFAVAPGQDILAAAAALGADTRVTSVQIEVLENPRVPR